MSYDLGYKPLPPPERIGILMDRVRGGWREDPIEARKRLLSVERLLDEMLLNPEYKEIYLEYAGVRGEVRYYYILISEHLNTVGGRESASLLNF
jgi:hypothetical protein